MPRSSIALQIWLARWVSECVSPEAVQVCPRLGALERSSRFDLQERELQASRTSSTVASVATIRKVFLKTACV